MIYSMSFVFVFLLLLGSANQYYVPFLSENRLSKTEIRLTAIGEFGIVRKSRPTVPQHLHTGIDIARPSKNYMNEPIFPIYQGIVISIRRDGPFAQIIIEHQKKSGEKFWTLYEHIAGIKVSLNENVVPTKPIARFMNTKELN